jgi:polyhydroxybutyrate depolymerase
LSRIAALLLGIGLVVLVGASSSHARSLEIDDVERTYVVHAPAGIGAGKPLVIVLHGTGESGASAMAAHGWAAKADKERFVVAAPDALISYDTVEPRRPATLSDSLKHSYRALRGRTFAKWDTGPNDIALIRAIIERMSGEFAIDRSRVYVAGFSRGGYMAHQLALAMPEMLAAVAVVAPNVEPELKMPPTRPVSFLLLTGDRDNVHPVDGPRPGTTLARWRALDHCPAPARAPSPAGLTVEVAGPCADGTEVRYVIAAGVDHAWPMGTINYTDICWEFFRRFARYFP